MFDFLNNLFPNYLFSNKMVEIVTLDDILKKGPKNDYNKFFDFLKTNHNSEFFVYTSIFCKKRYEKYKTDFLEKINKKSLTNLEKACIGSMLGMAIGDAIGARVEFLPLKYEYKDNEEKLKDMGKSSAGKFHLKPGQWTDDTSMGLCLADSLIEKEGEFVLMI